MSPEEKKVFEKYGIPARKKVQVCLYVILVLRLNNMSVRIANTLTLETTPSPKLVLPLRAWLVRQSQIRKSEDLYVNCASTIFVLMIPIDSIPHATSSGSSHNNGQKPTSISPTNSTSPVISGLANDENTIPGQLVRSGDETVPECEQSGSGEKSVPDHEQVSASGSIHNNGQKPISISPTNSTSAVIRDLANDENTIQGQLAGSGDETIPECEQSGSGEESVHPEKREYRIQAM